MIPCPPIWYMLRQWTPREWLGTVENMKDCNLCLNISSISKMFIAYLLFMKKVPLNKTYFKGAATGRLSWDMFGDMPTFLGSSSIPYRVKPYRLVLSQPSPLGPWLHRAWRYRERCKCDFPREQVTAAQHKWFALMPSRVALFSRKTVSSAHVSELYSLKCLTASTMILNTECHREPRQTHEAWQHNLGENEQRLGVAVNHVDS